MEAANQPQRDHMVKTPLLCTRLYTCGFCHRRDTRARHKTRHARRTDETGEKLLNKKKTERLYGFDDTMGDVGFEHGHGDGRPRSEEDVEEGHDPIVVQRLYTITHAPARTHARRHTTRHDTHDTTRHDTTRR